MSDLMISVTCMMCFAGGWMISVALANKMIESQRDLLSFKTEKLEEKTKEAEHWRDQISDLKKEQDYLSSQLTGAKLGRDEEIEELKAGLAEAKKDNDELNEDLLFTAKRYEEECKRTDELSTALRDARDEISGLVKESASTKAYWNAIMDLRLRDMVPVEGDDE